MDRIIQPYPGPNSGFPARPDALPVPGVGVVVAAPAAKSAADFVRALRRRVWLVLLVALVVIVPASILVIRQPDRYRATAQIEINPPKFDPALAGLLVHGSATPLDRDSIDKYVPNRLAILKGRALAEKVVGDPSPAVRAVLGPGGDPAAELINGLTIVRLPGTNVFDIHLDGRDPAWVATMLNALIEQFKKGARYDSKAAIDLSIQNATKSQEKLERGEIDGLRTIERNIEKLILSEPIFAPNGSNILEEELLLKKSILAQKQFRFDDLTHQQQVARLYPNLNAQGAPSPAQQRIDKLLALKEQLVEQSYKVARIARNPSTDPVSQQLARKIRDVGAELDRLQNQPVAIAPDLSRMTLTRSRDEIHKIEDEVRSLLDKMKTTMPTYQKYQALVRQREERAQEIATMKSRLQAFQMLADAQSEPVNAIQSASEPTSPSGPARTRNLVVVIILGVGLGIALVCALEWIDRRVKVPEHLTSGLSLPLFGVVPRIQRLARVHRGGHLWTPGDPDSPAADAYRNLRASLLGVNGRQGPLVTLLVTSAKASEGKSTTALNLAATCARAGERTLLMDCDLRRPSLGEVFNDDSANVGLVDCLRGELPWQRAVVRTDIANLDFLPTGDPSGTPIEMLGSLELRQLVTALAGYYDRVILDGPAVLGLADCRMLGQVVDSSLLVVRSGAHELRPLQRAKGMLEQSRVPIAGVVFNGLTDDLKNWSSYGPDTPYSYGPDAANRAEERITRGLDAPTDRAADARASASATGA